MKTIEDLAAKFDLDPAEIVNAPIRCHRCRKRLPYTEFRQFGNKTFFAYAQSKVCLECEGSAP